jgi:DNA-binding response OmpR family regulator
MTGDLMKNICVIEDEKDIGESIKTYMEAKGFDAYVFQSSEEFLKDGPQDFNGIYLVDWNLPGEPGIELVKKIRSNDALSPIFMVSAYNKKEDIIEGLRAGADDYITKPFSFEELEIRIQNATTKFGIVLSEGIDKSDFQLIKDAKAFIKGGVTVSLTAREYVIFENLVKNEGQPLTREDLITCFDVKDDMTARNIDVHIFSLRKKLKEVDMRIETVWGKGYKIS